MSTTLVRENIVHHLGKCPGFGFCIATAWEMRSCEEWLLLAAGFKDRMSDNGHANLELTETTSEDWWFYPPFLMCLISGCIKMHQISLS